MPLTQSTFAAVVLEDTDGRWEIFRGKLREKPAMSYGHNRAARVLARQLILQLNPDEFDVLQNAGHVSLADGDSYIPDVAVVPTALAIGLSENQRRFEAYSSPLPLVVEIWSPSTGTYDVGHKTPGYMARGDFEIWRIHPFEREIRIWKRQSSGDYSSSTANSGTISLHAMWDVAIDVESLFVAG
jgi:Uma2 family endonuclease